MEWIAHRGAAFDAPENSLEAIAMSIDQGAARVEIDVQLTADHVPIVCHDPNTARLTGASLEVELSTAAALRAHPLPNGEALATLDEVCALLRGRATIDLEIKSPTRETVRQSMAVLRHHDMLEETLFTAFDPEVLRMLRIEGFRGKTGLLIGSRSLHLRQRAYETWPLWTVDKARADYLVIHHKLAHPFLRRALHRQGKELILWTAMEDEAQPPGKRAQLYRRCLQLRPAGLIVARVAEARSVAQGLPGTQAPT